MFRKAKSGLISIVVIYFALQILLESIRPILPMVIMTLIIGGVAYMIIGRRTRL